MGYLFSTLQRHINNSTKFDSKQAFKIGKIPQMSPRTSEHLKEKVFTKL